MTYVRCDKSACPNRWDCDFSKCCWNAVSRAQYEINEKLGLYDEARKKVIETREAVQTVTQKPIVFKPYCPHNERSVVGICLNCGHWEA